MARKRLKMCQAFDFCLQFGIESILSSDEDDQLFIPRDISSSCPAKFDDPRHIITKAKGPHT